MGATLFERIVSSHLISGTMREGCEVGLTIDQALVQDATGPLVFLQLESLGVKEIRSALAVVYVDHNVPQFFPENADDHLYLGSCAARYGAYFSKAGNGICHRVHLERFARPGYTLLGADSHTPTCGALGMLAIGAGGLDVAMAMAGYPYFITFPTLVKVELKGELAPLVSAMDVALTILNIFTTKGNSAKVLEYGGEGVTSLSVAQRATIANLGAEAGVLTSLFPSDHITKQFMEKHQRGKEWCELLMEPSARYDEVVTVVLDEVVPLVAQPHSPDRVCPVSQVEGVRVDQVCVGSCANSSYRDLAVVAFLLKGRKVSPKVSLVVAPGSQEILQAAVKSGVITALLEAGARIMEPACGFCIGQGQLPPSGGVSLRTSNRNYRGRSGTQDAEVYLVSPETAAASALTGSITDPRSLGFTSGIIINEPELAEPVEEHLRTTPKPAPEEQIVKGPFIKELPAFDPLGESLVGEVLLKVGDNITTDHIIPGGSYLRYRSDVLRYAQFTFHQVDPTFYKRTQKTRNTGKEGIVIAGKGYGQGSSREHAALCPRVLGVRAVIALGIERIHQANLVNYGVLPLLFEKGEDYQRLGEGDQVKIERIREALKGFSPLVLRSMSNKVDVPLVHRLNQREVEIVLAGGLINYWRQRGT